MADCWHLKGANQGPIKPTMMTVNAHASTAYIDEPFESDPDYIIVLAMC